MSQPPIYANLEIHILKCEAGGYPVTLTIDYTQHFSGGHLPADILEWQSGYSPAESGRALFECLFSDDNLKRAWAEVRGRETHRRVRLRIDREAPELHALPWELLYEAHTLAADTSTPFSRYWESPLPPVPPITTRPIKMLAVIANPANLSEFGLSPVNLDREKENIRRAVAGIEGVELTFLDELSAGDDMLSSLAMELKKGCHILHLVAHGQYNRKKGEAALFLAAENGQVALVREEKFAEMLGQQPDHQPRLIFLAGCETAARKPADAWRGFAPTLVAAGVPAVVAMQDLVPVETARRFARVFYRRLLDHGLVDLAGNEARAAILTADLPGGGIPVLFSRLPDNRLFDLAEVEAPEPRPPFEPETVLVPAGPFLLGSEPGEGGAKWEHPQHTVDLPAYEIGRYPVTNAQYLAFVEATGAPVPAKSGWKLARVGKAPPEEKRNQPMVGLSWDEALAYCRWLGGETGRHYRLPSEAEWEKPASWAEAEGRKRRYPWGDTFAAHNCNSAEAGLGEATPVGHYSPQGDSFYGCADMAGNVWEWTSTRWGNDYSEPDYRYPYQADRRENLAANRPHREYRICRGGSFLDGQSQVRCCARRREAADERSPDIGFRVVIELT
jgi:formylglycine-generating enzyme required for sulfatase activity